MKCKYKESCGYEFCLDDCCPEFETAVETNADRIRAMSDEEIAQWLCLNYSCTKCPGQNLCTSDGGKHNGLTKWLKQPVEEDNHA